MNNHAVGYCRVSGPSQTRPDKDGFPRQREAIEQCCRDKGLVLLRHYEEEAVPGKLDEDHRPAFQAMVSDLLGNGCRVVICEALHRLAREYRTQEHLLIYLASKGLTLISADTGEDITAAMMGDPMRRALVQVQGIFSELEKNLLVAKLAKARQRKKELTGKGCGRDSFGVKPGEADVLDRIVKMHRIGDRPSSIARQLNQAGIPTRAGRPWLPSTVSKILRRQTPAKAA